MTRRPRRPATFFERAQSFILGRGPDLRRSILKAAVVGVPVLFLRFTYDPFNVPKLTLMGLIVALAGGLRVAEGMLTRSWRGLNMLFVPALAFAAPLLASWSFSPYRAWSLFGLHPRLQGLLPYLLVIALGILVADAFRGRADEIAIGWLWAGAVVGAYAVIQTLGLDPFQWTLAGSPTDAISTTGNPDFTGGFLGMVLPVGVALLLSQPDRRRTTVRLLAAIVVGWLIARSQGGWAAGVAGTVLVAGHALRVRWRWSRVVAVGIATLVLIAPVAAVGISWWRPESRFASSAGLVRAEWWRAAGGMASESPVVGRGPNTFAIEGIRYRSQEDALAFGFDFPDDPHSVPMSLLANLGVFGLLGFLVAIGWGVWLLSKTSSEQMLAVGFASAVAAYFVQATVSIDEPTLRSALWVALAGVVCASDQTVRTRASRAAKRSSRVSDKRLSSIASSRRMIAFGAGTLVVTLLGAGSLAFFFADVQVRRAVTLLSAGQEDKGERAFDSALSLRDSADYRGLYALAMRDAALAPEGGDREAFERSSQLFSSYIGDVPFVFSIVSYGRLLDEWAHRDGEGGDPAAVGVFERAVSLDPRNPFIRADAAKALIYLERYQDALDVLEPHIEVVPADAVPAFWAAAAVAAAEVGDLELAHRAVESARRLAPSDEFTLRALELLEEA